MKKIKSPLFGIANCKVVSVNINVPVFVLMGDLCVRAWIGVVNILAVVLLLGTSFIDRCN